MKKATLDWVQTLETTIPELFEIPLWQVPSPLSWQILENTLEKALQKSVRLQVKAPLGAENAQIAKNIFSQEPISIAVRLGNLSSACELVFHKQDLDLLLQESLFESPNVKTSFSTDSAILEGYLLFVATKTAALLNEQGFTWGQMLHIGHTNPIENEHVVFQDIDLKTDKHTFSIRLIMPSSFASELKHKFPSPKENILQSEKTKHIKVNLVVQCGKVALSSKELQSLEIGDGVILDSFSFDPETGRGLFDVQLQDQVIFHAKQKDDSLKLLGYGSHSQQDPLMNEFPPDDENHFSDSEIEFTDEEENFMKESSSDQENPMEEKSPYKTLVRPEETTLPVVVEVARLEISLDKLLELSPGNLLDLAVSVDQGVYLTVRNKRIARGELLRVGETLCVRILETAKN